MKKILIADDKESSRELIRTLLEHSGFEVCEAADGLDALEKAKLENPDLILLDIHMPRLDGYATVCEMRCVDSLQKLPIVALTASAMRGDHDKAIRAGFTAYITKPVSLMALRREIERLLV
ncbi:MAG TPA: response regulator [Bryobacteraceae bacterium]|nr:response regulator [Bryobacteraceae bacterium]